MNTFPNKRGPRLPFVRIENSVIGVSLSIVFSAAIAFACSSVPDFTDNPGSVPTAASTPSQLVTTHTSAAFGFAMDYPQNFVVMQEPSTLPDTRPALVHRVRFQTRTLATSQFADLEPPKLKIEVFAAAPGSLREWLQTFNKLSTSAEVLAFSVAGAREALHVADRRLLAPNAVYYVSSSRFVYALTPLDDTGARMAQSFRLLN